MTSLKLHKDYKTSIFTLDEVEEFYQKWSTEHPKYDVKEKIHYFDYNDFFPCGFPSQKFKESCRLIVAHNDKDIVGVCKFAHWDCGNHYAISYLSTNTDYLHMGVSKTILEKLFSYFAETYSNEVLNFSGYSVEGWKYLRKNILSFVEKYKVKIREKGIEYPGRNGRFSDEDYELMSKSKEEVNRLYDLNYFNYYN